jgi:hypothetical protein
VIEEEPDRSRGSSAAVDTDAAPPPTPGLLRLHRRPVVSTVAFPLFSLRRSCFLLCLWACLRAASAWARRAAVSPWTTPCRALPVRSRGVATPSRTHRVNQSGRELGLPCRGKREHVDAAPSSPGAERASRLGFLVLSVVPFWCWSQGGHGGGAGAPQRRARAVSNRRVKSLLGSRPGRCAGDPVDAAPSLGEPSRWSVSCAVSRPSSRGPLLQGLVSARAGRPHPRSPWPRPRHQRGTTRRRAAPRRARGVFPGHFVDHLVGDGQRWVKRE